MGHHVECTKSTENQIKSNKCFDAPHTGQNFQIETDKTKDKGGERIDHCRMDGKRTNPQNKGINGLGYQEPAEIPFTNVKVRADPGIFGAL